MPSDNDPITRAELAQLQTHLDTRFDASVETLRSVETNLLTEFHRYAKGQQARLHAIETSDADMKQRLHQIEERLLELERRIRPA